MLRKKSFTLVEILVVIVIMGILAAIAFPGFEVSRERALDKEAQATLRLMQAAEKVYYMEEGSVYYASSTLSELNSELKLALLTGSTRSWDYLAKDTGCVQATRNGNDSRNWRMLITNEDPAVGACL